MIGQWQQRFQILVDHQHRELLGFKFSERSPDIGTHERCEPLGGFIEDQQARIGHQRATDGEHLLFAARERATELAHALAEAREQADHAIELPRFAIGGACSCDEVFAHSQAGKDLSAFRHEAEAQFADNVWRGPGDFGASKTDPSRRRRQPAAEAFDQRAFAHAVAPEECGDFTFANCEVHIEEHVAGAVTCAQTFDFEKFAYL